MTIDTNGPSDASPSALAAELATSRAALAACRAQQRELDEFISLLAHDLRTPLTSIRGYAQLLLRSRPGQPPLAAPIASGLETIIEQSDRLASLTSLLLDVSRVRLDRIALRHGAVDVAQTVRAAVASLGEHPEALRVTLEAPEARLSVNGDAARLQQVVRAVIDYVLQRAPGAGTIAVHLEERPPELLLHVSDAGPTLDREATDRLFGQLVEPAGGANWHLARPELYIARGLIEAHQGRVAAESPVPGASAGIRISLWLPLAR